MNTSRLDLRFQPLVAAVFVDRPNRFLIRARTGDAIVPMALLDPGRLSEILRPGARLLAIPANHARRSTAFTAAMARDRGVWVGLVPALSNQILQSALSRGTVPGLKGARVVAREVVRGSSRLDFVIGHGSSRVLTEVKSVTLVVDGQGLFPDAPTARGTRHVRELIAARRAGEAAQIVFVAQRADVRSVSPNPAMDPAFAEALADAVTAGVVVRAYVCRLSRRGVALLGRVPFVPDGSAPARAARVT